MHPVPSATSQSFLTACARTVATTRGGRRSRRSRDISSLERLGVPPERGPLYEEALTHRSYAFENPSTPHNERLEFLGDAILGAVVTDHIFNAYPGLTEGEMARLRASVVNTRALARAAESIDLGEEIRLGRGEESSGGRAKSSLLANTFEALIGAVYLDRGIDVIRDKLLELLGPEVDAIQAEGGHDDAKTRLQEVALRSTGSLPAYEVASRGPDHDKRFTARVSLGGRLAGEGDGRSKKEAEQEAARRALESLADAEKGTSGARAS